MGDNLHDFASVSLTLKESELLKKKIGVKIKMEKTSDLLFLHELKKLGLKKEIEVSDLQLEMDLDFLLVTINGKTAGLFGIEREWKKIPSRRSRFRPMYEYDTGKGGELVLTVTGSDLKNLFRFVVVKGFELVKAFFRLTLLFSGFFLFGLFIFAKKILSSLFDSGPAQKRMYR